MLGGRALDVVVPALPLLGRLRAVGQGRRRAEEPVALHAGRQRHLVEAPDRRFRSDWQRQRDRKQRQVVEQADDHLRYD